MLIKMSANNGDWIDNTALSDSVIKTSSDALLWVFAVGGISF